LLACQKKGEKTVVLAHFKIIAFKKSTIFSIKSLILQQNIGHFFVFLLKKRVKTLFGLLLTHKWFTHFTWSATLCEKKRD